MVKPENAKPAYRAPALEKGLEILELLSGAHEPIALSSIAKAMGRSKAEIYRMLIALEARGYIARGENDERYRVTSRLFELAMRNAPTRNLHEAANPVMHALAANTLQSCHLGVASGDQLIVIARVESPASVGFSTRIGYRAPLVETTSGRVIFGNQNLERQKAWGQSLQQSAPSRAAWMRFQRDAKEAARQGYFSQPSRLSEGIHDVAAPVFDGESMGAVASLTTPYFAHRYLTASLDEVVTRVIEAADEISKRLRDGGP